MTQLPVTCKTVAAAEGMPQEYLAKVLQRLVKAGFIKAAKGPKRGYVFAVPPEEIHLSSLFASTEDEPLFGDCPLRYCVCGGTSENCHIYAQWLVATREFRRLLEETSVAAAAWHHPEHRFEVAPDSAAGEGVE
jgi:Rrf2 family protein